MQKDIVFFFNKETKKVTFVDVISQTKITNPEKQKRFWDILGNKEKDNKSHQYILKVKANVEITNWPNLAFCRMLSAERIHAQQFRL